MDDAQFDEISTNYKSYHKKLRPKDKLLLDEWIKDYNLLRAFMVIYPKVANPRTYAYKVRPELRLLMTYHQETLCKASLITNTRQLNKLDDIINDPDTSNKDRIKAIELQSKLLGLLNRADGVEEIQTVTINIT
jgi:hypothetical protein